MKSWLQRILSLIPTLALVAAIFRWFKDGAEIYQCTINGLFENSGIFLTIGKDSVPSQSKLNLSFPPVPIEGSPFTSLFVRRLAASRGRAVRPRPYRCFWRGGAVHRRIGIAFRSATCLGQSGVPMWRVVGGRQVE